MYMEQPLVNHTKESFISEAKETAIDLSTIEASFLVVVEGSSHWKTWTIFTEEEFSICFHEKRPKENE